MKNRDDYGDVKKGKSVSGSQASAGIFAVIAFGLVACVLYGIGAGIRSDIGILLNPLADQCGIHYEDVSLCIAVMQFVFGAAQPVFGMIASRKSNRFVLILGTGFLSVSLIGMMLARSFAVLMFSLGILFGCGTGAIAFGLVLTSAIYFVGQEHAMIISGMLNAAAGMGGFIFSPLLQSLLQAGGTARALSVMIVPVLFLIPVAYFVTSRDPGKGGTDTSFTEPEKLASGEQSFKAELSSEPDRPRKSELPFKNAFSNKTYRMLVAGFMTCGFHMIIIESHLFSQYVSYGIAKTAASWAFSVYGIATILGALLSGFLSSRFRKGRLLGFYYGFRAVWTLFYIFLLPKNVLTAVVFAIGLGMTGDATVSPTSGLVNENFSLKDVATLIGLLFLVHQIGAFFSAWFGGVLLKVTGSYTAIWMIDVVLCIFASSMSLRIREKPNK